MGNDTFEIVTLVLLALAAFDWLAVVLLTKAIRRARGKRIKSLEDRRRIAALIAVASTLGVFLGLNRVANLGFPPETTLWVLVLLVFLPSLGNLWFVIDLLRGAYASDVTGPPGPTGPAGPPGPAGPA
jgi:L-asparagine transporter-like permease